MLARDERGQRRQHLLALQVLADRDEFHLRRDDAAARVVHLRDVGARPSPARAACGGGRSAGRRARDRRGARGRTPTSGRRARRCRRARRSTARAAPAGPCGCRSWRRDRCRGRRCRRRRSAGSSRRRTMRGVSVCAISRIGTRMSGARALDVDLARVGQRRDGRGVDVRVAREELVVGVHGGSSAVNGAGSGEASSRFPAPALSAQVPRV